MERGSEVWSQDSSRNPRPRRSRPHTELGKGRASMSANTEMGNGKESRLTSSTGGLSRQAGVYAPSLTGRTQPVPNL